MLSSRILSATRGVISRLSIRNTRFLNTLSRSRVTRPQHCNHFNKLSEESMATNLVQIENDSEIKQRLAAERVRLRKIAGLDQPTHFHRPVERAFTSEERGQVTILFGGFTWKHEDLIRAVFQGCGYRCEKLPVPNVAAFQTGKEFGNNGQCNPTYFTVGNRCSICSFSRRKAFRARRFWTTMSSSPPVRVVLAASACTRPSTASP